MERKGLRVTLRSGGEGARPRPGLARFLHMYGKIRPPECRRNREVTGLRTMGYPFRWDPWAQIARGASERWLLRYRVLKLCFGYDVVVPV